MGCSFDLDSGLLDALAGVFFAWQDRLHLRY
jgi:hypothetical protein